MSRWCIFVCYVHLLILSTVWCEYLLTYSCSVLIHMFAFLVKKNNNYIYIYPFLYYFTNVRWIKLCDSPSLFLLHAFTYLSYNSKTFASLTSTLSNNHPYYYYHLKVSCSKQLICMVPQPLLFHLCSISLAIFCWVIFFVLLFPLREAIKVNGQMDCHPSAQGANLSPSRHNNVKKVTGVGGTTYEISVWAGTPHPPPTTTATQLQRNSTPCFGVIIQLEDCLLLCGSV